MKVGDSIVKNGKKGKIVEIKYANVPKMERIYLVKWHGLPMMEWISEGRFIDNNNYTRF